jgi:hypothetical protein
MHSIPIQNVAFADTATSAMGEAFDKACNRCEVSGLRVQCVRSSQNGLLQWPGMASAIPPVSMSKHYSP